MIGFIIGCVSGALQFWLLSGFTKSIVGGAISVKAVLAGVLQLFLPLIVLLAYALIHRDELMWAGIGMAAALLSCAVTRFIINMRQSR